MTVSRSLTRSPRTTLSRAAQVSSSEAFTATGSRAAGAAAWDWAGASGRLQRTTAGTSTSVRFTVLPPTVERENAPGRIRTSDQQLRRLLLYPPELRARVIPTTT